MTVRGFAKLVSLCVLAVLVFRCDVRLPRGRSGLAGQDRRRRCPWNVCVCV